MADIWKGGGVYSYIIGLLREKDDHTGQSPQVKVCILNEGFDLWTGFEAKRYIELQEISRATKHLLHKTLPATGIAGTCKHETFKLPVITATCHKTDIVSYFSWGHTA